MSDLKSYIQTILEGTVLSQKDMIAAMQTIMSGSASEVQLSAFLTALSARGAHINEITGAATVMRQMVKGITAPEGTIDCCGTGGDASGTYNISTVVALVLAACGVPVAKHGNRAASSKSGTADVLEAFGVNLDMPQEKLEEALQNLNYCFLMAPNHHPAMKHVVPVRKELGFRTIFNILGPLANPANTKFQLLGVYDESLLKPMAETLKNLGTDSAWIVHGTDGLDEITTTAETKVAKLKDGQITYETLSPADFGLTQALPEDLKGGDAIHNAAAIQDVLYGKPSAYRDIVLANAAAGLVIVGKFDDLKDAVSFAAQKIDDGSVKTVLDQYIAFSNGASQ